MNQPVSPGGKRHAGRYGKLGTQEIWLNRQVLRLISRNKPDFEFSSDLCSRAFTEAKHAYQRDLPLKYASVVHENRIAHAKKKLAELARGPAVFVHMKILEDECTSFWRNNRQSCEEVSLTGRRCILGLHATSDTSKATTSSKGEGKGPSSNSRHNSGHTCLHACDCGRSRAARMDPFTLEEANIHFFKENFYGSSDGEGTTRRCCSMLPRYSLKMKSYSSNPWSLSTEEERADISASIAFRRIGSSECYDHSIGILQDGFAPQHNFLVKVAELGGSAPVYQKRQDVKHYFDEEMLAEGSTEDALVDSIEKDIIHLCVRAGRRKAYERNNSEVSSSIIPQIERADALFVGLEYESTQGRRYILSEDEILRVSTAISHEEMADAVLSSTVPLSFAVGHSDSESTSVEEAGSPSHMQLQRLYIVTPRTGKVYMQPRIRIACVWQKKLDSNPILGEHSEHHNAESLQFHVEPLPLEAESFYVLRLPYIYSYGGKVANLHDSSCFGQLLRHFIFFDKDYRA